MRLSKVVLIILAMLTAFLMTGQPVTKAMESGFTWPTEPSARSSIRATGSFTLHEITLGYDTDNCGEDYESEVYMILKVRTGNSFTWDLVTAKAPGVFPDGTYCVRGNFLDLEKQFAIIDFLNSPGVRNKVCPDCGPNDVVHLKRVFDDLWDYEDFIGAPPQGYSAVAEFELIVNQTPVDWNGYTP